MGYEWIVIDYNGGTYISINISKNRHSFPLFLGPVDLYFGQEIDKKAPQNASRDPTKTENFRNLFKFGLKWTEQHAQSDARTAIRRP